MSNVHMNVTLWCVSETTVDMEEQPYLSSMQSACAVLHVYYHL